MYAHVEENAFLTAFLATLVPIMVFTRGLDDIYQFDHRPSVETRDTEIIDNTQITQLIDSSNKLLNLESRIKMCKLYCRGH